MWGLYGLDATSSGCPVHCLVLDEPVQQGNWVTMRQHSHGSKQRSSVPIKTLNRFSPLSDAPTEKPDESALVIGDSIVRNVKMMFEFASRRSLKIMLKRWGPRYLDIHRGKTTGTSGALTIWLSCSWNKLLVRLARGELPSGFKLRMPTA